MKKDNRVIGLVGVGVKNGSFNQGWDGYPRQKSDGEYVATDVCLKWAYRYFWNMQGKPVFSFAKMFKNKKNDIQHFSINEKYEDMFGAKAKSEDSIKFVNNLLGVVDVMNFGIAYAGDKSVSLTGVVQFGLGINKYEDTEVETFQILSPFRNSNEKSQDKLQKTSGTYTFVDEAHYMYSFTVNPAQMNEWKTIDENIEYTQEAYEDFKEGSLVAVSSLNTRTKINCQNEFAMFIELKKDSLLYLPNLDQYVTFRKEDDKNIIDITKLSEILNSDNVKDQIDSIEIYYNSFNLTLEGDINNAKKFNIITRGI
ncbi:hypothetical protein ADU80_09600 [Clostridium botulinum]|uniref:CRISPR-associated protein n=2 Tax=Clostridium botulinum TaxID=1491 RepID=A0A9Q1ZCE4_CLOBO|nr:hypothetical protein ADU77_13705 [Clostridium botulinum]MCD3196229.1 type I CRISPR-associated protein Cas7 [Clostridium botulinum C/D]KOA74769.1 hypothetical protein ADU78_10010 [Clostridium botulinum]KOA83245.1 hypothetical protein ADU75_11230 [Clostridium botulinum]KOA84471.1 hypothetical protein ADU80_09600 [Clostridium botulinum]